MSYIVAELEADVLMELNRKQTEQIHGGWGESPDVEFDLTAELGEANRIFFEALEKYWDDNCIVISLDPSKLNEPLSNEPLSVDDYICYREVDELPDSIGIQIIYEASLILHDVE